MIKTTYWTLKEVLESLSLWSKAYETGSTENTLVHQFQLFLSVLDYDTTDLTTDQKSTLAEKLWMSVVGKYQDSYLAGIYPTDELSEEAIKRFAINYMHLFNDTLFKYKTLINIYDDNLSMLMDGIKAETESKFNDTPQNIQGTYDWDTDNHLTNVTRNETTTDGTTKMARIREIEDSLSDLYSKWTAEFHRLFLYD